MTESVDTSVAEVAAQDAAGEVPPFGDKLRDARRRRGLTQAELANLVGVSKGFVSQLERNNSQVSVANLVRICGVVGIDIGSLFQTSGTGLVRKEDRSRLNLGGHGVRDFLLTPPNNRGLRLLETEVSPLGSSGAEAYALVNELESVHVYAGHLEVRVDGTSYLLGEGDTLTFSGDSPHFWRNPSASETTTLLWALVQVV